MKDEASIIARLCRAIPNRSGRAAAGGVAIGIGDDAAVLRPRRGREWALSTDALVEGAHFLARVHPPEVVGFKALARAASDLAAMGAEPRYFLLTLSLPAERAGAWLERFARGMARAARRFGMELIGGDVSRHDSVVAALTVLGEIRPGRALTRSGARPGDALYVSGRLGAAQAGLELLLRGGTRAPRRARNSQHYSLERHLYPVPRLALGAWLAACGIASAAMDLSDGLSTDLARLCVASHAGAVVHAASLPLAAADGGESASAGRRAAALARALHGGEDYELLFTVRPRRVAQVPAHFRGVPLTRIGEIVRGRGAMLLKANGRRVPLPPQGWDHFARP